MDRLRFADTGWSGHQTGVSAPWITENFVGVRRYWEISAHLGISSPESSYCVSECYMTVKLHRNIGHFLCSRVTPCFRRPGDRR
ncbi:unnamed protein product [Penicillium salamii]|nr:unnamed protein product [Penicillium salamii]